jgi:hypothetical protein
MYDRPDAAELVEAARQHIEAQLLPVARATNRKLYFQTLVAMNVLHIVERELAQGEEHLYTEWARLNMLFGNTPMPKGPNALREQLSARNSILCQAIRSGKLDDNAELFEHLKATTIGQLEVANPKFLATLYAEDEASA